MIALILCMLQLDYTSRLSPAIGQMDERVLLQHKSVATDAGTTPGRRFFTDLSRCLPPRALSTYIRLATVDRAMLKTSRGQHYADDQMRLIRTRNAVQHALVSLPAWSAVDKAEQRDCDEDAYKCCRLASALYSGLALFSLPPHLGWHTRLAGRLRLQLQQQLLNPKNLGQSAQQKEQLSGMVLWCLAVGCAASQWNQHREFYTRSMRAYILQNGISSLGEIESIAGQFVWSSDAGSQALQVYGFFDGVQSQMKAE